jgi:uncharacterized membrane protein (DUF4010 family)
MKCKKYIVRAIKFLVWSVILGLVSYLLNRIAGNSESLILGLLLCILVDNDRNIK